MMKTTLHIALFILAGTALVAWLPEQQDQRSRGERIYTSYCLRCHGRDGRGLDGMKNIRERSVVQGPTSVLVQTIAFGASGRDPIRATGVRPTMPAFPYDDQALADVAVYTSHMMAGKTIALSVRDVQEMKQAYRDSVLRALSQRQ